MNYKKHYEKLISKAQNRSILKSEYYEVHHIIPKCVGGDDSKENLIELFPEEHLLAHLLLVKINPKNSKLIHAANMMTNGSANNSQNKRITNKEYAWVKKKHAETLSLNNPMFDDKNRKLHSERMKEFNKTYVATEETNLKISNTVKESWKNNDQRKEDHSKRFKGENNPRFDNTLYEFKHKGGKELICYQSELKNNFGCDRVYAIINGSRKSANGWKFTGRMFKRIEI